MPRRAAHPTMEQPQGAQHQQQQDHHHHQQQQQASLQGGMETQWHSALSCSSPSSQGATLGTQSHSCSSNSSHSSAQQQRTHRPQRRPSAYLHMLQLAVILLSLLGLHTSAEAASQTITPPDYYCKTSMFGECPLCKQGGACNVSATSLSPLPFIASSFAPLAAQ